MVKRKKNRPVSVSPTDSFEKASNGRPTNISRRRGGHHSILLVAVQAPVIALLKFTHVSKNALRSYCLAID